MVGPLIGSLVHGRWCAPRQTVYRSEQKRHAVSARHALHPLACSNQIHTHGADVQRTPGFASTYFCHLCRLVGAGKGRLCNANDRNLRMKRLVQVKTQPGARLPRQPHIAINHSDRWHGGQAFEDLQQAGKFAAIEVPRLVLFNRPHIDRILCGRNRIGPLAIRRNMFEPFFRPEETIRRNPKPAVPQWLSPRPPQTPERFCA